MIDFQRKFKIKGDPNNVQQDFHSTFINIYIWCLINYPKKSFNVVFEPEKTHKILERLKFD